MENCVFIKCALFFVIFQFFCTFTKAKISSAEARTLNRKIENMNNALLELQELRQNPVKCECQRETDTGRNLGEPEQSTKSEIAENEKELFRIFGRLLKAFEHEKHLRKQTERFVHVTIKAQNKEIGQMKEVLIGMNKMIDKLTEGAIGMNTTIDKLTEGAIDMKSTITSQHGKIHHLTNVLERLMIAIPVCETPPSIEYGNVKYHRGTMVGSMALYTCNHGYSLRGERKRKCLSTRQWAGNKPQCIPACAKPPSIQYGNVEYPSGTMVGSTATYTCNDGYSLRGESKRKCLSTRQWEGNNPQCIPACAKPLIQHGHVEYPSGIMVGSTATYTCNDGYSLRGKSERKCLPTRQWEGDERVCIIEAAPTVRIEPRYQTVDEGAHVKFVCLATDTPASKIEWYKGSSRDLNPEATVIDGVLTIPIARLDDEADYFCRATNVAGTTEVRTILYITGVCSTPSPLLNGQVKYTTIRVGSKATYSCDVGFARDGLKERVCLPTAEWEGETPVCIQVCSTPSPLLHGHVEYTTTRVGSKATYSCDVGFARDGLTERICLPTAAWEGETPVCVQVCHTPSPLLHGHVEYTTTRVGSKATYSCDVGFARDGLTERICLPTAKWEGKIPVCVQVCSTPPPLLHGHVEYTTTRVGSKVTYSCDVGFARDGLKERMCLPTAEWEGETPVCIQGVCSTPSPLLHGHVEYTTTHVGSKATYSCDVGFARHGLKERICLPTAEWERETPVCVQGYRNCQDILDAGLSTGDGLYTITVIDEGQRVEIKVYCDMTTDNGGWTVFQYRYDGSEEFYRVYNDYTEGFGHYPGEFWLGLKWVHAITTRGQYMLRVDLTGKDPSGDGHVTGFAQYTNFSAGPAAGSYTLHVDGYLQTSTIKDNLEYHNGRGFTTKDHDVDSSGNNCAVDAQGAWWYGWCYHSNLNGRYLEPGVDDGVTSMFWYTWPTGSTPSLVASQLSFKPV